MQRDGIFDIDKSIKTYMNDIQYKESPFQLKYYIKTSEQYQMVQK